MIANKKEFGMGLGLMVGFWAAFALFMSPVFSGKNLLDYMDNLYNSISKGSSYYLPKAADKAKSVEGKQVSATIKAADAEEASRIATLLATSAQAEATVEGTSVKVKADLGRMLAAMIADADLMYANKGKELSAKYSGMDSKLALYGWYLVSKSFQKSFQKDNDIAGYNAVYAVMTKALEPAYNYYGIEAFKIKDNLFIVAASLAGYVVYTLWFGFAILFMFEGWGLKLEH